MVAWGEGLGLGSQERDPGFDNLGCFSRSGKVPACVAHRGLRLKLSGPAGEDLRCSP